MRLLANVDHFKYIHRRMYGRRTRLLFLLITGYWLLITGVSACIHKHPSIGVVGYKDQTVTIKGGEAYSVGPLSSKWRRLDVAAQAVAFYNDKAGATISTDAFCKSSFEDLPLATLTAHLFKGVDKYTVVSKKELDLNGRGALRTVASGEVDGVPLKFDTVVLKKNFCTFDFMLVTPSGGYERVVKDFEEFYKGFHY